MAGLDRSWERVGGGSSNSEFQALISWIGANFRHVEIGDVKLGERNELNPDQSKPNPVSITWKQENVIVKHKIVGGRPLTQCIEDDGLWYCDIEIHTMDTRDEVLDKLVAMKAGPWWVKTSDKDLCMYIESKSIVQEAGTKDWLQTVKLGLCEAND